MSSSLVASPARATAPKVDLHYMLDCSLRPRKDIHKNELNLTPEVFESNFLQKPGRSKEESKLNLEPPNLSTIHPRGRKGGTPEGHLWHLAHHHHVPEWVAHRKTRVRGFDGIVFVNFGFWFLLMPGPR